MTTITPDPKPGQTAKPRRSKLQVTLDKAATENAIANLAPQEATSANIAKVAKDLGVTKKVAADAIGAANAKAGLAAVTDAARRALAPEADDVDDGNGPTPIQAALIERAKASAARRAANAADKAKVKGLNAEESAARKAKTAALHASFVDAFKGGKSIGQIAAEFVNPDTGKPRSTGAVRNVLIAAGLVKVGEPRAPKFDADLITNEQMETLTNALGSIGEIAQAYGVSVLTIVKAINAHG